MFGGSEEGGRQGGGGGEKSHQFLLLLLRARKEHLLQTLFFGLFLGRVSLFNEEEANRQCHDRHHSFPQKM